MFVPGMNGFVEINESLEVLGRPKHLLICISPGELGIQWTGGWCRNIQFTLPPPNPPCGQGLASNFHFFAIIWILSVKHSVATSQPIVSWETGGNCIVELPCHQPSVNRRPHLQMSPWPKWSIRSLSTDILCPFCETPQTWGDSVSYHCFLTPEFRTIHALDQLAG